MGVPAFYRWLSEKYPKCVLDILEQHPQYIQNTPIPINSSLPIPNAALLSFPEFDNLYIDMNGIIHPCSHPESGAQPKTETEMFANVAAYVTRIFEAVRPRKLLFLAIDGTAPRAKMNQQVSECTNQTQTQTHKLLPQTVTTNCYPNANTNTNVTTSTTNPNKSPTPTHTPTSHTHSNSHSHSHSLTLTLTPAILSAPAASGRPRKPART